MHGFKSFANHTELVFGNGFNCILGPNGSGKSNIGDAICFVLGKSSAKGMRAEKGSGLIYNGGKHKEPAGRAEVSIFFDNSKKIFPTEDEIIKISRIIKKNGQSVYKINDKSRTRQQILELLALARIDPDGHNIVLQGDVTKFVDLPPLQKRMIIEEISDIAVYEEKKHKAMNELDKTDERLKEAEIVLTERKTYLKELRKDRDQALRYKNMNDAITQNRASYLNLKIQKRLKSKNELQSRSDKNKQEIEKQQLKINKLKEDITQRKQEVENITKEIEEKGEVEQLNLRKQVENLKVSIASAKTRLNSCKNEIVKLEQRREQLKLGLKELDEKISSLNEQKSQLINNKNKKIKSKKELDLKLAKFKSENKLDTSNSMDKEVEEIDGKIDEQQKQVNSLIENQQNLLRDRYKLEFEINTIDSKIDKVKQIEKEHSSQINELKNKKQSFKTITLELNKLLNEDSSVALQLVHNRKQIFKLKEGLAKLEARAMTAEQTSLGSASTKALLKSGIKGIYGTMSSLGKVDSQFSAALSTAASRRLNSIVVEDDKTANQCINYLKKNRLGTASFIPLNKIKARETSASIKNLAKKSNSVYGLALDLVNFDPKFKKAFSFVFANTIIVKNIETARKLGLNKAKYVALDGDVAEISGVMHGGFRKLKAAGFKEQDTIKDLDQQNKKITEVQKIINSFEKKREENEKKITELRQKKANLDGDIIKTERSLHLDSTDIDASKEEKQELKSEVIKLDKQIEKLKQDVLDKNKEITNLKIKKQELRNQITQLRDPALLAELNTFEQQKTETTEEIIKSDAEIKNIDIQINDMLAAEKANTDKILKQNDRYVEEFRNEIKELTDKISSENKSLAEKEKKAEIFYSKFKELFNKRTKENEIIQKNEIKADSLLQVVRGVESKNNMISLDMAKIKAELAGLEQDFEQYQGVKLILSKQEDELKREITKFEKLKEQLGSVNLKSLEIYDAVVKEYEALSEKKIKIEKEKQDVLKMMDELEKKKSGLFMETYNAVSKNFQRIYSLLSKKGNAYMQLENPQNPFEGGMTIQVKIASNKHLDIRSLSGGEKTLTTLAFIFAIQEFQPASFYILDEVDAALDKHNSEKFAGLIRNYTSKAQYVIISHNDALISEADSLYGISMAEHGVSKVTSLKI